MLLYVAASLSIVALLLLACRPVLGVALVFLVKPLVDTTFATPLVFNMPLTYLVGSMVPLIVFGHILFAAPQRSLRRMPLRKIWLVYLLDLLLFSLLIVNNEGVLSGLNVFFRQINGFIGFYMVQAFYREEKDVKLLLLTLAAAGLFPIGVGLYQIATGTVWLHQQTEGLTRYIGMYHDAATVRWYAFQTIFGLLLYGSLYLKRHPFLKIGTGVYLIAAILVLFKAYSKAGLVSLAAWVICWTALQKKFIALILTIIVGTGAGIYYASDIADDIEQLFHKEIGLFEGTVKTERTFSGRWYGWKEMVARWERFHWLSKSFGSGETATGAHNDYLQILYHGGLLAVGLYLFLLASIGTRAVSDLRRKIDPMAVAALMLFLMWVVDTIGLVPSAYPGYQWFVWGFIGLSFRMRDEAVEQSKKEDSLARAPLESLDLHLTTSRAGG